MNTLRASQDLVTTDNWTYTGYKLSNLLAFLHLVGAPSLNSSEEIQILYSLTVLENESEEVFQEDFSSLAEAILAINKRYQHWQFTERSSDKSSGGCGDCAAH